MTEHQPSMSWVMMNAVLYVLSGVTQPILMAYASHAGLANPKCQLYMLFYYIGPASVAFTLRCRRRTKQKKEETKNDSMQQLLSNDSNGNDVAQNNNGQCSNSTSYGATSKPIIPHNHNGNNSSSISHVDDDYEWDKQEEDRIWPSSKPLICKGIAIALFDILAQSMCYTGNNFAGPTIFSIIYSSVTIWAAIFSKILLSRSLARRQWMGVGLVVVGLSLTAMDSLAMGRNVFIGACLILIGSLFHGLTYVMCEKIMTPSTSLDATTVPIEADDGVSLPPTKTKYTRQEPQHLSIRANCAIQGIVAMLAFLLWQLFYTLPRLEPLILTPMADAGTTPLHALTILGTISLANLLHSATFFTTLKHYPGGATSAGVMKGLQAVLVFAASAMILCGRWGGMEMCWSSSKGVSLVVVVCGIMLYAMFTEKGGRKETRGLTTGQKGDYRCVGDVSGDDERIMCV